jgi:hypothetical protein
MKIYNKDKVDQVVQLRRNERATDCYRDRNTRSYKVFPDQVKSDSKSKLCQRNHRINFEIAYVTKKYK